METRHCANTREVAGLISSRFYDRAFGRVKYKRFPGRIRRYRSDESPAFSRSASVRAACSNASSNIDAP
jgi:hypothetical protein